MKLFLRYFLALFALILLAVTSCKKEDLVDNELIEKAAKIKTDKVKVEVENPKEGNNVGDLNHGGIIFWVDPNDSNHGLVCALSDIIYDNGLKGKNNVTIHSWPWGCNGTLIAGTFGQDIGDGQQNTFNIIQGCDEQETAAHLCNDYSSGGYDDWFLPSYKELEEMYIALKQNSTAGNFFSTKYWSSTQLPDTIYVRERYDFFTLASIVNNEDEDCAWTCDWNTEETELGYFFAKGIDFTFGTDFLDVPCPGLRTKEYTARVRPIREYGAE